MDAIKHSSCRKASTGLVEIFNDQRLSSLEAHRGESGLKRTVARVTEARAAAPVRAAEFYPNISRAGTSSPDRRGFPLRLMLEAD